MSTEKTDALVIRMADFSESSRVVTLFTRDFGKVSAIAKGGRRLKGPFEAALDLLTLSRIVFIRKSSSSLDILTEAQLISRFRPNGRSLTSLYGGYYVAELLSGLTEEYDPHQTLFEDSVETLEHLAHDDDPNPALLRFELAVLREIGQLPVFDCCLICEQPVDAQQGPYAYWVQQSGMICRACRKQEYNAAKHVESGTVMLLARLAADDEINLNNIQFSSNQQKELRQILTSAISHVLGRRPKMLRYLNL